jgi:hypothetical protein
MGRGGRESGGRGRCGIRGMGRGGRESGGRGRCGSSNASSRRRARSQRCRSHSRQGIRQIPPCTNRATAAGFGLRRARLELRLDQQPWQRARRDCNGRATPRGRAGQIQDAKAKHQGDLLEQLRIRATRGVVGGGEKRIHLRLDASGQHITARPASRSHHEQTSQADQPGRPAKQTSQTDQPSRPAKQTRQADRPA